MWTQQINTIAVSKKAVQAEKPKQGVPVDRTGPMVLEQLEKIRELLRKAPGNAMTTRQLAEDLNIPVKNMQLRMARLREGREVKMLARGFNESAIWKLITKEK